MGCFSHANWHGGPTNLQTFSAFAVSKGSLATLNELNRLNNLRDELHITGLHHILHEYVCNYIDMDLLSKENLTHLTLQWSTFTKTQTLNNDKKYSGFFNLTPISNMLLWTDIGGLTYLLGLKMTVMQG